MTSPEKLAYFDTMSRWARHQKLWWRVWHLWLRPSPYMPMARRVWGYLWRFLFVLLLAAFAGFQLWVKSASADSRDKLAAALTRLTGTQVAIDEPHMDELLRMDRAVFAGKPGQALGEGEMRGLGSSAPKFRGVFSDNWELTNAHAREALFSFFSPKKTARISLPQNPSTSKLTVSWTEMDVSNATVLWDRAASISGQVTEASVRLLRGAKGIETEISGGILSLPLFPDLKVDHLDCLIENSRLTVANPTAQKIGLTNGNGEVKISGGAAWQGDKLNAHLGLAFGAISTADILPKAWADEITGNVLLKTSLKGANFDESQPAVEFEAQITRGTIPNLQAVELLSSMFKNFDLSKFPFETAIAKGKWSRGKLTLTSLQATDTTAGLRLVAAGVFGTETCRGELLLGVPKKLIPQRNLLLALGQGEERDDFYWFKIPLVEAPGDLSSTWANSKLRAVRDIGRIRIPDINSPSEDLESTPQR